MSKFMPQNFNDLLALILIGLIAALWIIEGKAVITLGNDVNGALVVLFTLVVQYYFRTRPPSPDTTSTTTTTTIAPPTE